MSYALQNTCQKENERISIMPFLLWHFSTGDKIENCPAYCDLILNSVANACLHQIWQGKH